MRTVIMLMLFTLAGIAGTVSAQSEEKTQRSALSEKIDTTGLNLENFSQQIVDSSTGNYEKAKKLLDWLSNRLEWKATDYKQRTVKEILARGGGNCFELAKVYMALIKELKIQYRPVAEINVHQYSEQRQNTAQEKVERYGNSMSVFGLQHNDHRWVEIYDQKENEWVPADPSMNVIGTEQWLKARVWFGERMTIDTSFTNAMLVPFAIFVVSDTNKMVMTESRTKYYLVTQFDRLYNGELSKLPSWNAWVQQLEDLDEKARSAFSGAANLHARNGQIAILGKTYLQLKGEYLNKHGLR